MTRCTTTLCTISAAAVILLTSPSFVTAGEPLKRFDGRISRAQLEHILSRAITMEGLLHETGDLDDEIRMLKGIGVRFAGRAVYVWGGEGRLDALLKAARAREKKIHEAMPELILQAAVFEIVTKEVDSHHVPPDVFEAFGLPKEDRNFSWEGMLYPEGKFRNHWAKEQAVPDITQTETQLWCYYLAKRYIDIGVEGMHFGQVNLMGQRDKEYAAWDKVLGKVRSYAREHARRGIILCDAHVPFGGLRVGERLLLDFHSFPLRIDEDGDDPSHGALRMGYLDSLFGRSMGGITPSGWSCEHLPFLVEFDNFGRSGHEGQNIGAHWIWGYDEISWFAHLTRPQRDQWLRYAHRWIREHDPNGYLQMPGSRTIAAPVGKVNWYWASDPGPKCPTGFGDESTIREIWQGS